MLYFSFHLCKAKNNFYEVWPLWRKPLYVPPTTYCEPHEIVISWVFSPTYITVFVWSNEGCSFISNSSFICHPVVSSSNRNCQNDGCSSWSSLSLLFTFRHLRIFFLTLLKSSSPSMKKRILINSSRWISVSDTKLSHFNWELSVKTLLFPFT